MLEWSIEKLKTLGGEQQQQRQQPTDQPTNLLRSFNSFSRDFGRFARGWLSYPDFPCSLHPAKFELIRRVGLSRRAEAAGRWGPLGAVAEVCSRRGWAGWGGVGCHAGRWNVGNTDV